MTDHGVQIWGDLVCVTLRNGGTQNAAEANIVSTNADAVAAGVVSPDGAPLDDIAPSEVVSLAITYTCPQYESSS